MIITAIVIIKNSRSRNNDDNSYIIGIMWISMHQNTSDINLFDRGYWMMVRLLLTLIIDVTETTIVNNRDRIIITVISIITEDNKQWRWLVHQLTTISQ